MIKAKIAAIKTIPAETSLAILALSLCFSSTRLITSSIAVLTISATRTRKIATRIASHSIAVILKTTPRMIAAAATTICTLRFWWKKRVWQSPRSACKRDLVSLLKLSKGLAGSFSTYELVVLDTDLRYNTATFNSSFRISIPA